MLTLKAFLIVCPLVFLAGFVDSIGGGGGLISLPAYIFAGLPTHMAVATNKLSSALGTSLTTAKFIKEKLINFYLAVPTVICAIIGASIGARLSLKTDEKMLGIILVPVLLIAAFLVLNKKIFKEDAKVEDNGSNKNQTNEEKNSENGSALNWSRSKVDFRVLLIGSIAALIIGGYDGFYGPGTGTFLIIAFHVFAKLNTQVSNAQAKVINLTTNITSLVVFVMGGQVVWVLGLAGAISNMLGNYFGANLVISKGSKITRPIIICVLALLCIKIVTENIL